MRVSFFVVERCTLPMRCRCNNLKYYDFKEENTMKKIINGKLYNTETAKEVGTHKGAWFEEDCYFSEHSLYMKENGEWFLVGKGNSLYCYDKDSYYGELEGGYIIYPISNEEAKVWIEKYMDVDTYIKFFGEVEE